jgi:hypothetical protein
MKRSVVLRIKLRPGEVRYIRAAARMARKSLAAWARDILLSADIG